jgi:hypothetical protein
MNREPELVDRQDPPSQFLYSWQSLFQLEWALSRSDLLRYQTDECLSQTVWLVAELRFLIQNDCQWVHLQCCRRC